MKKRKLLGQIVVLREELDQERANFESERRELVSLRRDNSFLTDHLRQYQSDEHEQQLKAFLQDKAWNGFASGYGNVATGLLADIVGAWHRQPIELKRRLADVDVVLSEASEFLSRGFTG